VARTEEEAAGTVWDILVTRSVGCNFDMNTSGGRSLQRRAAGAVEACKDVKLNRAKAF
jgi:hypothetical protein